MEYDIQIHMPLFAQGIKNNSPYLSSANIVIISWYTGGLRVSKHAGIVEV